MLIWNCYTSPQKRPTSSPPMMACLLYAPEVSHYRGSEEERILQGEGPGEAEDREAFSPRRGGAPPPPREERPVRRPRQEDGDEDEGAGPPPTEEADLQGVRVLPFPREDAGEAAGRGRRGDLRRVRRGDEVPLPKEVITRFGPLIFFRRVSGGATGR